MIQKNGKLDKLDMISFTVWQWTKEYAKNNSFFSNLKGLCAIASAKLFFELKKDKIYSKIILNKFEYFCHCYVIVDDLIIDITASQFDSNHTYFIKPINEVSSIKFENYFIWETQSEFIRYKDFEKFLIKTKWWDNQIPKKEIL